MKKLIWIGVVVVVLGAVAFLLTIGSNPDIDIDEESKVLLALETGRYEFDGMTVILKNREAIGPLSPRHQSSYVTKITDDHFAGDLDGDGDWDGVAYFTRKAVGGDLGSASYYIAAVVNTGTGYHGTKGHFIGRERLEPVSFKITEGYLAVTYNAWFPDQTANPGYQEITTYFKLVNGQLIDATAEYMAAHQPPPITDADEAPVRARATEVLQVLKKQDPYTFAKLVHPTAGVTFGFDGHVSRVKMSRAEIEQHVAANDKIFWGIADGSGFDINQTFMERFKFYNRYDYLAKATASYKRIVRGGAAGVNTVEESFPGKPFISYFIPYTDTYRDDNGKLVNNEMSWSGLNLVFDKSGGQWYLIGIISDNWTI